MPNLTRLRTSTARCSPAPTTGPSTATPKAPALTVHANAAFTACCTKGPAPASAVLALRDPTTGPSTCSLRCHPCGSAHLVYRRYARRVVARSAEGSPSNSDSTAVATTAADTGAQAPTGSGGPSASREALLARIARAKQYKQGGSGAGADQPAGEGAAGPGPGSSGGGGGGAAGRAAGLPRLGPTKVDWGAVVGFLDAPTSTNNTGPGTSYPGAPAGGDAASAADEAAAAEERRRIFMAGPEAGADYMAILMATPRRDGAGSAAVPAAALAGVLADPGSNGGSDSASGSGLDPISPDLRMEEFTALKEARLRALGGEVITADVSYNPGGNVAVRVSMGAGAGMMAGPEAVAAAEARRAAAEREAAEAAARAEAEARAAAAAAATAADAPEQAGTVTEAASAEGEAYRPKVSTWGMFPRPRDISEAYGGGRNLKPGQELETPAQRSERERSYAAALAMYKARAGLEVDPEAEERAAQLYEDGMQLFGKGQLRAAAAKFDAALAQVPVKSKYGGLATLQKAIVLDSVGESEAAQKLYKSVANHAVAQVSKKAKQMLFSFDAMTFMKADQFSYGPKKGEYEPYFRPLTDRRTYYAASQEEAEADEAAAARTAGLAVLGVIVAPLLAVAGLALQGH